MNNLAIERLDNHTNIYAGVLAQPQIVPSRRAGSKQEGGPEPYSKGSNHTIVLMRTQNDLNRSEFQRFTRATRALLEGRSWITLPDYFLRNRDIP